MRRACGRVHRRGAGRLRQAVGDDERHAERGLDLLVQRRRDRRRAAAQEAQRRQQRSPDRQVRQHARSTWSARRSCRSARHCAICASIVGSALKRSSSTTRRAGQQGHDELVVDAVGVVERHDVEQPVVRARAGVAQHAVARCQIRLPCVSSTPFGRPVLPEVNCSIARSSRASGASTKGRRRRAGARARSAVTSAAPCVEADRLASRALVDHEAADADDAACSRERPRRAEPRLDHAGAGPRLHRRRSKQAIAASTLRGATMPTASPRATPQSRDAARPRRRCARPSSGVGDGAARRRRRRCGRRPRGVAIASRRACAERRGHGVGCIPASLAQRSRDRGVALELALRIERGAAPRPRACVGGGVGSAPSASNAKPVRSRTSSSDRLGVPGLRARAGPRASRRPRSASPRRACRRRR